MDTTKNFKARFKRPVVLHHKLLDTFIYIYTYIYERDDSSNYLLSRSTHSSCNINKS